MGETFRLDALTQSDEFNEMAEYLFSIRWEEKKERFSVASLINYSDQSTEMIEIEQFRQKIEQFTLSKHGDIEIEMRCDKLKRLNEEAQSFVNKVKFNRASGRSEFYNRRASWRTFFSEEANLIKGQMPAAILNTVSSFEENISYSDPKKIEKELNFMVSTLESATSNFLKDKVSELSDKLNLKFEIGSSLCQEFVYRKIHENIEAELGEAIDKKKLEDKVSISCKMTDKIIIDLLENLSKKSAFWKEYTRLLSTLRSNNNKSGNEIDMLNSMEIMYNDLLIKINFLLELYSSEGNKKIVFQYTSEEERGNLFSWNRAKRGGDSTDLFYVITPAIVDDKNQILHKGVGLRVPAKRLVPYKDD